MTRFSASVVPICVFLLTASMAGAALGAAGAGTTLVTQQERSFSTKAIGVARGSTVRFRNEDSFLHQVYVDSPAFRFTSSEQEPGSTLDVKFPITGSFTVRCEIHPKMALAVSVE